MENKTLCGVNGTLNVSLNPSSGSLHLSLDRDGEPEVLVNNQLNVYVAGKIGGAAALNDDDAMTWIGASLRTAFYASKCEYE